MFKWGRNKKSTFYEPKTPKLSSISLPDERYVPVHIYQSYSEKQHTHKSHLRDPFTSNKQESTPLIQPTAYHRDLTSVRSRPRTMSTPVREVEAPRPIRPHPSQGPFLPILDHRTNPSHVALAPVGVPSAAFLEEQLRRQPAETRTVPPPNKMIDLSDYVYPEETKLREVAKHRGDTVTTRLSNAYLDSLKDQKRDLERVRAPSAPSKRSSSNTRDGNRASEKEIIGFDDYNPVPVKATKPEAKKVPGTEPKGPLKSALKKPIPPKPALKSALRSAMKKSDHGHNNASHSEPEAPQRINDRVTSRPKPQPIFVPSKAYLEEQQEKIEEAARRHARHQNSTPARPTVHEFRPSAFAHTHSSSTGSSPSEYGNTTSHPYDTSRSRRGSYVDPRTVTVPSNYITPYIREVDPPWGRVTNPPPLHPASRPSNALTHVPLTWPLVEFASRRRENYPLVYFDTAFNPRMEKYAIKTKNGLDTRPLSEGEKEMPAGLDMHIHEMWIVHKALPKWPVHVKLKRIRVIDVFMWIYDEYAEPLTAQELMEIGPEYLERCRPYFDQRCRDGPSWQHVEEKKGILRIDLLRGRRRFVGLQPIPGQPTTYELLLD